MAAASSATRHRLVEIEPAEPSVRQMQLDFLAQPPLEADAVAIAHNPHPNYKLGINRRPANLAVGRRQLLAQVSQHLRHDRIDPPQQMSRRNALLKIEQLENLALIAPLPAHHGKPPSLKAQQTESLFADYARPFSTTSPPIGHLAIPLHRRRQSALQRIRSLFAVPPLRRGPRRNCSLLLVERPLAADYGRDLPALGIDDQQFTLGYCEVIGLEIGNRILRRARHLHHRNRAGHLYADPRSELGGRCDGDGGAV